MTLIERALTRAMIYGKVTGSRAVAVWFVEQGFAGDEGGLSGIERRANHPGHWLDGTQTGPVAQAQVTWNVCFCLQWLPVWFRYERSANQRGVQLRTLGKAKEGSSKEMRSSSWGGLTCFKYRKPDECVYSCISYDFNEIRKLKSWFFHLPNALSMQSLSIHHICKRLC